MVRVRILAASLTTACLVAPTALAGAPGPGPGLSFDVTKAAFHDTVVTTLALDEPTKKQLARDGVVKVQDGSLGTMAEALHRLFEKDQPLLVTSDMVLDALHRSIDDVLAELEQGVLAPALEDALGRALKTLRAQPATDTDELAARDDADLYLSVAQQLLADGRRDIMRDAPKTTGRAALDAVIDRVDSGGIENGAAQSTLYGAPRRVDWTQFIPRGHYGDTVELTAWFRAVMWLGRPDTGFVRDDPRQAAAIARVERALDQSGARARIATIVKVVDLFAGKPDAFPEGAVRSQVVVSAPDAPANQKAPASWALLRQRQTLDGVVLSNVVYDSIVWQGQKMQRGLPSGLDVAAAAFGNDLALRLLAPELARWHYDANLAAMRELAAKRTTAAREASLYDRWLDALSELSRPPAGANVPEVMRGEAWSKKMLSTQLASWAELRSDMVLFVAQSYSASAGCVYPRGFVEPYPAFFRKLARLARAADRGLAELKPDTASGRDIVDHVRKYFARMAMIMDTLAGMADDELVARAFSPAEEAFLKDTIERRDSTEPGYGAPPIWDGWYMDLVFRHGNTDARAFEWDPTVADVHTDADSGQVLTVATGAVELVVAAIDNGGDRAVYVGPAMSYFEFTVPASERMDKSAWQDRLNESGPPAAPSWLAPIRGKGALTY